MGTSGTFRSRSCPPDPSAAGSKFVDEAFPAATGTICCEFRLLVWWFHMISCWNPFKQCHKTRERERLFQVVKRSFAVLFLLVIGFGDRLTATDYLYFPKLERQFWTCPMFRDTSFALRCNWLPRKNLFGDIAYQSWLCAFEMNFIPWIWGQIHGK